MTRDEIIRMAREAGIGVKDDSLVPVWHLSIKHLKRFAALVAAAEREACAVAAWSTGMGLHMKAHDAREIGSACAAAIRARNNVQQEPQSKD